MEHKQNLLHMVSISQAYMQPHGTYQAPNRKQTTWSPLLGLPKTTGYIQQA